MSKKVILAVDDERIVLDSIKRQLKEAFGDEYSYEIAESATEALELLEELQEEHREVVLIITDFIMPTMNGDDFLRKAHGKLPQTAKIILTGQADEKALSKIKQEVNLLALLSKPWTEEQLISTIKKGIKSY
ncbi:MAG: response regulator [Flammeovirgaceae bacterium]|nr:response regulator [Flammeovirgaceae bacterium]MDW8287088.1 response regulator [Flammeovirgaceae bacterium]